MSSWLVVNTSIKRKMKISTMKTSIKEKIVQEVIDVT